MAALEFTKQGENYIAETTVNGDYSLHLERTGDGKFMIYQKSTADGQYVSCTGIPENMVYYAGKVIDYSFSHGVYPKYIRIESGSEVTKGELTEEAQ